MSSIHESVRESLPLAIVHMGPAGIFLSEAGPINLPDSPP
jgi:hypothetical protein